MTIQFYSTLDEWGEFSNFARFSIQLDDKYWPTSEHYFQAQKFENVEYRETIRTAPTAMEAAKLGRSRKQKLRGDWESVKDHIMFQAVYAKFTQHQQLTALLLSTENKKLVEHTSNDSYWGDGGDGSGHNKLGLILMEVRAQLLAEIGKERSDLSPDAIRVRDALRERQLETPFLMKPALDANQRQQQIQQHMQAILQLLNLDLTDDSLAETPARVARMYVSEIFSGLDYANFPKITMIENKMKVDEMVTVRHIEMISTCEHHLMTFDGFATVAYIPRQRVIGLSKINRIVRFFAQRPQVQERLTQQIVIALQTILETEHVAASISARHYCVKARGISDSASTTTTTSLGGIFKTNPSTRAEFLQACIHEA